jgi:hypothetical protein
VRNLTVPSLFIPYRDPVMTERRRVDLFTLPGCGACEQARAALREFSERHGGIEVREWDLSARPVLARDHGICVAPTALVDGTHVLIGVPGETDLLALLPGGRFPERIEEGSGT